MKLSAYITIALVGLCTYSQAQNSAAIEKDLFFIGYEIAIPASNDYLTKTSWNGARLDYRHMVTPNLSVGMTVSFNSFEQYFPKQTYQFSDGSGAVTGDMIRQVYTSPILATAHYYFEGDIIKPYAGIGIGAQYSSQGAYFNIYNLEERNWGFAIRPEFGITGKLGPNTGAFMNVGYNYATNGNGDFGVNHLSHFPITIGVIFKPY